MKLFCLKHDEYGSTQLTYYTGPDMSQEEFKNLCDSLLPDAAKTCLGKQLKSHDPYKIQWPEILEELDLMLLGFGFSKIELAETKYSGWDILSTSEKLLGKHVVKAIQKFNKKIEDGFQNEIKKFGSSRKRNFA